MKRAPKTFFTLFLLKLFGYSCSSEKDSDIEPSLEEWKESVEFLRYSINQSLY